LLAILWQCKGLGAMPRALPDAACPELHLKPPDTAIVQLLALYCPGGRQDPMPINKDKNTPTLPAILMAMAMHQYNTTQIVNGGGPRLH
jgi:hypothetical protein